MGTMGGDLAAPSSMSTKDKIPHDQESRTFIDYSLHQLPLENISYSFNGIYYKCSTSYFLRPEREFGFQGGGIGFRQWAPPNTTGLVNQEGVLDFQTSLKLSNISILTIGDSLARQAFNWIRHGINAPDYDIANVPNITPGPKGNLIREYHYVQQNGSSLIYLPMFSYFEETHFRYRNKRHRSWSKTAVDMIVAQFGPTINVCLMRTPHPHMPMSQITEESLRTQIETLEQFFGCRLVLLMTIQINNNLRTEQDMRNTKATNNMIRSVASSLKHRNVQVLEVDRLSRALVVENARRMGLWENETWTLRLAFRGMVFPQLMSVICSERVRVGERCPPNMIAADGIHWCPESMAARSLAAVACMVQCGSREGALWTCRNKCNDDFMSIKPVSLRGTAG